MALASLIVRIGADISDMNKALTSADRQAQRFGGKMQRVGTQLSAAVTLPLVGIGVAATKMAADAQEAANKFDVVMGPPASRVREELAKLHQTIPLAQHEMEGLAAGVQDMLVPFGVARDEAADMSAGMVRLAGDLAAFNDVSPEAALRAIQSALAGSSEPMLRFGVDTRVATLEAIALSEGLIKEGEALTSAARAQAVMIAIQRDSTDATGAAAREAEGASASFRFFARDAKELGVAIGEILLPVVTPMIQKMSAGLRMFQGLSPTMQKVIVVTGGLVAAMAPLLATLGVVLKMIPLIKLGFAALTGPVIGPLILAVAALTAVWVIWGDDIKRIVRETVAKVQEWFGKLRGVFNTVGEGIEKVTGFFAGMYNAVVGNSYVPDMIDGIEAEFARLDAVMVQPALAAASKVNNAFAGVSGITLTEEGRERSLASRRRTKGFEAAGGILTPITAGRRGDPHAGAKTEGFLGKLLRGKSANLSDNVSNVIQSGAGGGPVAQMVQAASAFGPLAVLLPVINGALEVLGPVIESLMEPLVEVGRVVGAIVAPVLEMLAEPLALLGNLLVLLLEPVRLIASLMMVQLAPALKLISAVLKVVTTIFSYMMEGIGMFVKGLGAVIDKLAGWFTDLGDKLEAFGQEMIDNARAARKGTDGAEDLGEAAAKAAGQLMNYANVVHINALRFRTTGGSTGGGTGGAPGDGDGPGDAPLEQPGNRDPYEQDTRERRRRRNPYEQDSTKNQATSITVNVNGATDPKEVAREVLHVIERAGRGGAPSGWSVALA